MNTPAPPLRFGWRGFLSGLTAIGANQVVYIVGNLAVVPLFLAHWSTQRYGEWLTLSSLVGYLSTLDMGMNTAGGNRLIQEYARGDFDSYRRYQHSALAFYGVLTLVASFALGIAVWLLPIVTVFPLASRSATLKPVPLSRTLPLPPSCPLPPVEEDG